MSVNPAVLCPVDFSENARGALRYAAAIAAHFGARLTLLAVNDPLLGEAADLASGPGHLVEETVREARKFFDGTFEQKPAGIEEVHLDVAAGKPAQEILRVARDRHSDLIVMGSHGSTGFRKLFFGSTTERVLRETMVPVLVTPAGDPGPRQLEDVRKAVRRVLVPVDLTAATAQQLAITRGLADALDVPVLVLHVIEPVRSMVAAQPRLPKIETERRHRAERTLELAAANMSGQRKPEALIAYGEPSEEIAKVATDRDVGLIVMGLHSSPLMGPRMGSVTYRVLCLAHKLVLALPPRPAPTIRLDEEKNEAGRTLPVGQGAA
jgi:nucleotide-binding universal stress UspA family protein